MYKSQGKVAFGWRTPRYEFIAGYFDHEYEVWSWFSKVVVGGVFEHLPYQQPVDLSTE
jgi:hypothetical protein